MLKWKNICTLFLLLCMQGVLGVSTAKAVTLEEARAYINRKSYPQALTAFRTLMQNRSYAQRADCNKWMGEALCMTGHYEESVPYLRFATQRRVTGAFWYYGISLQHTYDFEGAIASLEEYKSLMKRSSDWQVRSDSIIAQCKLGQKMVSSVQNVVIIDSLVVPKSQFFAQYRLGNESGRLLSAAHCGAPFTDIDNDAVIFESQQANYRMMAAPASDSEPSRLLQFNLLGNEWSDPEAISSVSSDGATLAYPFMRTDGETLYFASNNPSGLGGYDLYCTRLNTETGEFFTPERMGMPFNSPYNDYMLAIDETHQVGWWATDRSSAPEFVTIYLFLYSDEPSYLEGENVSRARIASIAETWEQPEGYASLIQSIFTADQEQQEAPSIFFVINNDLVYTSEADFKSDRARTLFLRAQETRQDLVDLEAQIEAARKDWHNASPSKRKQMRASLLQNERRADAIRVQLSQQEKMCRNAENQAL